MMKDPQIEREGNKKKIPIGLQEFILITFCIC